MGEGTRNGTASQLHLFILIGSTYDSWNDNHTTAYAHFLLIDATTHHHICSKIIVLTTYVFVSTRDNKTFRFGQCFICSCPFLTFFGLKVISNRGKGTVMNIFYLS